MIPCQRHLFDLPEDVTFLRCAAMSPNMLAVEEAGTEGLRRKRRPWTVGPQQYFADVEALRGLFAGLIGATADDIAIVPSASYGIEVAAANVSLAAGRSIVLLAEQFPSHVYPWREVAKRTGATIVTVPRPGDFDWTAAIMPRIDERCAVVALPHCHWTDGGLVDLERVSERCRAVGAQLVIDSSQSLGMHPLDVAAIQPDFLVNVAYKWLLGPYGLAFLYAAPKHHQGEPIEHNWVNRADSQNYAGLVDYRDDYQPGARRYDVGERGNFVSIPMAIAALRHMLDWGAAEIADTVAPLTRAIGERARTLGLVSAPPELRLAHMIGLRAPAGLPEGLAERLAAEQVYVSVRGDAIRVAPHLYNDERDVDRLLGALGSALGDAPVAARPAAGRA